VDLLSKPTEEENEIVGDSKGEHLTDETLKMQNEVKEPLGDNTGQVAEVINNFDVNSEMVVENKVENLMEVKVRSESEDIEVKGEIEHVVEVTNTMMLSHLGAVYNYLDHQKESIENLDVVKTKRMKELVDKLR
jgi:flagellin-like hook-associated protein FlgL